MHMKGIAQGRPSRAVPIMRGVMLSASLLGLAACESSTRLGSLLPGQTQARPVASIPQAAPAPLAPAPSTDVDTADLPPPPGAGGLAPATPPGLPAPATPPTVSPGVGTAPGNLPPTPAQPAPTTPQVATAPVAAPPPASRTSLTGSWSLTEGAGNRCRLTLSSAPKLDLYGAGTSGCQSRELQRVNAWELAGSEVILYEPGGGVVARLRSSGAGTYAGASARSGAPVSMTK
jgi:hypothetical protein